MIANDNTFLLFCLKNTLDSHFKIETVENGFEAVEKVKNHDKFYYDVIILDINMPIMDGIEASKKIYAYLHGKNVQALLSRMNHS